MKNIKICLKQNAFSEQFLKELIEHEVYIIKLWNKNSELFFEINSKHLSKLRFVKRKFRKKVHIRIVKTATSIHQLNGYTLFTFLLFLSIPFFLSQFLWSIEIQDSLTERKDVISSELIRQHIYKGQFLKKLPTDEEIRSNLLPKYPDLSWIHVNRKGSKFFLSVETLPNLQNMTLSELTNEPIRASRGGAITQYIVYAGQRTKKLHQTVKKGDILIANTIETKDKTIQVGAQGKVFADYWIEKQFAIPKSQKVFQLIDAKKYWQLKPLHFKNFEIKKSTIYRYKVTSLSSSDTSEKEIILQMLRSQVRQSLSIDGKIQTEKILQFTQNNDKVEGKILYLVNDNIAVKTKSRQGD